MEDTLRDLTIRVITSSRVVLILVLMEDTLRVLQVLRELTP